MAAGFNFKKRLGEGYFGQVWYAVDTGLDCEVAVKCIPEDKIINQKNFYQEAQLLKAAEHPNIVSVRETGQFDDGQIYVSMEYLKNGSLEDEVRGSCLKLSRAIRIMIDILRGLNHAHQQGIFHRDIKPANIMIGNANEGKLSDFGLAIPDITTLDISYLKKYQYMLHLAPEVNSCEDYTKLSDIYACGVTFYRLINGDKFLPSISPVEARYLALQGKFPDRKKYRNFIPRNMRVLINRALNIDPAKRFQSADDMRHAIEKLNIKIDWEENLVPNGVLWEGQDKKFYYKVNLFKRIDKKWCIEAQKGTQIDSLRRIRAMCHNDLTKAEATRMTCSILQTLSK